MHQTWQLVRAELRRKWVFVALLAPAWAAVCVGLRLWVRQSLLMEPKYLEEAARVPTVGFPLVIAMLFGVALFQSGEKDGARFFLYHHPLSRVRLYLVRYLTGLALVGGLSAVTLFLTPCIFGMKPIPPLDERAAWVATIVVLIFAALLVYTAAAFFSPLLATELTAAPVAALYCLLVLAGLFVITLSVDPSPSRYGELGRLYSLTAFKYYLPTLVLVFLNGLLLFRRRRILEASWSKRANVAARLFLFTLLAFAAIILVNPIDLLYLMGIDVFKYFGF